MVTRFYYTAILLAAFSTATDVVSQSTVLLKASIISVPKPESTVTPLTRINAVPSVTTLAVSESSSVHNVIISSTAAAQALPSVVSTKSKKGGFQGKLKKKTTAVLPSTNETTEGSLRRRDDFTAEIVNHWLVVFDVGTPPQLLELSLDLGSDGFVVESTLVEEDLRTTSYPIYSPDNSTSSQLINGYTWEVYYGGFALNGIIYTDTITLGDNSWHNMTMEVVTGMPYGSAIE